MERISIKMRPIIIKQHINPFKIFTKAKNLIRCHMSLTMFVTLAFSKASATLVSPCNNFNISTTCFYTTNFQFLVFKIMVFNLHCQYERLCSSPTFLQVD